MMARFHLILTICTSLLFLTACSRPQTLTPESSPTTTPKAEEPVKSAADQASKTVQSALDKAKSATEQAAQTAQSTIDKAKSATEQASKTVRSTIDKAQSAADKATQSASEAVKGAIAFKEGLQGMSTGVSSTITAVNSGDFTAAQQEFSKLQGNWAKVGDTVKTRSAKVYQQVNSHLSAIATLLKEPNPDRAKLVTELQALGKTLTDSLAQL
mgnify:CR=1 FL=1